MAVTMCSGNTPEIEGDPNRYPINDWAPCDGSLPCGPTCADGMAGGLSCGPGLKEKPALESINCAADPCIYANDFAGDTSTCCEAA